MLRNKDNRRMNLLSIDKDSAKILYKPENGEKMSFDIAEGYVCEIRRREFEYHNQLNRKYVIILEDESGRYGLEVGRESSYALHIINALATVEDFRGKLIRIEPWLSKKTGYVNVSVYANDARLDWLLGKGEMPSSAGDRVATLDKLVDEIINPRARAAAGQAPAPQPAAGGYAPEPQYEPEPEPEPEDMPEM